MMQKLLHEERPPDLRGAVGSGFGFGAHTLFVTLDRYRPGTGVTQDRDFLFVAVHTNGRGSRTTEDVRTGSESPTTKTTVST